MAMEAQVANADVPVEAGSQEIIYTVSATFALQ